MCLRIRYSQKEKKKFLDSIDGKWIKVQKLVYNNIHTDRREALFKHNGQTYVFDSGLNVCLKPDNKVGTTGCSQKKYLPYLHFFYNAKRTQKKIRKELKAWPTKQLITCYIHKKNVSAVGEQEGFICIIAREAIFPTYPKMFITPREKRIEGIE